MGEANPEAIARIEFLTGHKVEQEIDGEGKQFIRIGETVVYAAYFGLWSDPSIYVMEDAISIQWGGYRFFVPIQSSAKINNV